MIVVGNREKENHAVSVRSYKLGDLKSMPFEHFIEVLLKEIATKSDVSGFAPKNE